MMTRPPGGTSSSPCCSNSWKRGVVVEGLDVVQHQHLGRRLGGEQFPEGEPIDPDNGYIWEVGTEEQAKQALKEIRFCIEESALPFFESITDRQKLVDFIHPVLRRDGYADVVEKILAWKPKE